MSGTNAESEVNINGFDRGKGGCISGEVCGLRKEINTSLTNSGITQHSNCNLNFNAIKNILISCFQLNFNR